MALGLKSSLMLTVMISTLWLGAIGQSTNNCMSTIISLSPCLSYIRGSGGAAPTSSCCSSLAKVVSTKPECLCVVLAGGLPKSLGITIDRAKALALPGACNVKTPPVSKCDEINGAPTPAPLASDAVAPAGKSK